MRDLQPFAILAAVLASSLVLDGCLARGDESAEVEARTRAALALAKAQRDRETFARGKAENPCRTDWAQAFTDARAQKKPLVLWVGMECADKPDLRIGLGEVIHLHCDTNNGSKAPRVLIVDAVNRPGEACLTIHQADLGRDAAAKLLAAYRKSQSSPPKGGLAVPRSGTVVGRAGDDLFDPEFGYPRDNLERLYFASLRGDFGDVPDASRESEETIRAELRAMRARGGGLGPWPDGKGPDLGPPAFEFRRPVLARPALSVPYSYGPPAWGYGPPGLDCPPGG